MVDGQATTRACRHGARPDRRDLRPRAAPFPSPRTGRSGRILDRLGLHRADLDRVQPHRLPRRPGHPGPDPLRHRRRLPRGHGWHRSRADKRATGAGRGGGGRRSRSRSGSRWGPRRASSPGGSWRRSWRSSCAPPNHRRVRRPPRSQGWPKGSPSDRSRTMGRGNRPTIRLRSRPTAGRGSRPTAGWATHERRPRRARHPHGRGDLPLAGDPAAGARDSTACRRWPSSICAWSGRRSWRPWPPSACWS